MRQIYIYMRVCPYIHSTTNNTAMDFRRDYFANCATRSTRQLTAMDKAIHELVQTVYRVVCRHVSHLTHVVIAGGYAAYLENVTARYGDIDIFLVGTKTGKLNEVMEIMHTTLAPVLKGRFYTSNILYDSDSRPILATVTAGCTGVEINVMLTPTVFLANHATCDWITASVGLLTQFDLGVCKCCLWKDTTEVFRIDHVSLRSDTDANDDLREQLRILKYKYRLKTYGTPMTLFAQSCHTLGLDAIGFSMHKLVL